MHDNLVHLRPETPPSPAGSNRKSQRGPWARLLAEVLRIAGSKAEFLRHTERPWSSVTFSGTRHTVALAFVGAEAMTQGESYIAALPEHEFAIPGHLVADAAVIAAEHQNSATPCLIVEAELLLLEDA